MAGRENELELLAIVADIHSSNNELATLDAIEHYVSRVGSDCNNISQSALYFAKVGMLAQRVTATVCVKHLELEFLLLLKAVVDFYFVAEVWVEDIPQYLCTCILLPTTAKGVVEYYTQRIRFG